MPPCATAGQTRRDMAPCRTWTWKLRPISNASPNDRFVDSGVRPASPGSTHSAGDGRTISSMLLMLAKWEYDGRREGEDGKRRGT
jgi:hypothetical protein